MAKPNDAKLLELIKARCYQDGDRTKFNCADAIALAAQQQVDPLVIADVCNRYDIRIAGCRLGCFK